MRAIEAVRKKIQTNEFDYAMLTQALSHYRKPRDAISRLLKEESIIRVKKGFYVFGHQYRKGVLCMESIANLIYGPSYISLEYALSYYGFIPERVQVLTSMTSKRGKKFQTPLGAFEYIHLHYKKIAIGVTTKEMDDSHQYLIATPEKALADKIASYRNLKRSEDAYDFVCQGLRVEEDALKNLDLPLLKSIATIYNKPGVSALLKLVKDIQC